MDVRIMLSIAVMATFATALRRAIQQADAAQALH
jgi:hypothetical protein